MEWDRRSSEIENVVESVVLAFDLPTQPGAVARRGIDAETSLCLGPEMTGTVGGGRDFDVREGSPRSLIELVFDAGVGNLNLSVDDRKLDLIGDLLADVLHVSLGIGFALVMDRSMDLGFQLEVECDARICTAELLDPGGLFQISAVDLRVMLDLTPFDQASVNFLIRA